MAVVKSLLIRLEIEMAVRQRICHRSPKKHSIKPGEACLVTVDSMGGKKNYCRECYVAMLSKAQGDLDTLRANLGL